VIKIDRERERERERERARAIEREMLCSAHVRLTDGAKASESEAGAVLEVALRLYTNTDRYR